MDVDRLVGRLGITTERITIPVVVDMVAGNRGICRRGGSWTMLRGGGDDDEGGLGLGVCAFFKHIGEVGMDQGW